MIGVRRFKGFKSNSRGYCSVINSIFKHYRLVDDISLQIERLNKFFIENFVRSTRVSPRLNRGSKGSITSGPCLSSIFTETNISQPSCSTWFVCSKKTRC